MRFVVLLMAVIMAACASGKAPGEPNTKQTKQAMEIPPEAFETSMCEAPEESPYEKEIAEEGYFGPSITDPIPVGKRINFLDEDGNVTDAEQFFNYDLTIQRLTDRSFLMQYNVFQSYVYLGDEGLLMMDAGGHNAARPPFGPPEVEGGPPTFVQGGQELANIEHGLELIGGGLPLHTLVLSHPHTDHVGHSQILKARNPNLRVVGSEQLYNVVKQYNYPIALPDRRIRHRWGHFKFEGKKFYLWTPVDSAHSSADSMLISPDGVQMSVDLTGPGRLSFIYSSVVDNPDGLVLFNRVLLGAAGYECDVTAPDDLNDNGVPDGVECEEAGPTGDVLWEYGIFGHFNIGYVTDVIHTLRYYRDMYSLWWPILFGADPMNLDAPPGPPKTVEQFIDLDTQNTVDPTLLRLFNSQTGDVHTAMAPKYFQNLQWKSAWTDIMEVNQSVFLYRSGSNQIVMPAPGEIPPGGIPDFDPIAPGTRFEWNNWMF